MYTPYTNITFIIYKPYTIITFIIYKPYTIIIFIIYKPSTIAILLVYARMLLFSLESHHQCLSSVLHVCLCCMCASSTYFFF